MLTFGSLFAGIGGIDLGLERAGMRCEWQVEIDDYATRVLEKHWPAIDRRRDVRDCGAHNLEWVDLIAGGFPCQPHSTAGKRKGAADERNLWPEFARIIRELRPRWVLAENVLGLLSTDSGRFFGAVLSDLAALGYDAEWESIPAAAVGAPHIRDRVYIVAYTDCPRNGGTQHEVRPRRHAVVGSCADVAHTPLVRNGRLATGRPHEDSAPDTDRRGQDVSDTDRQLYRYRHNGTESVFPRRTQSDERLGAALSNPEFWAVEPDVGRVADGVPSRMDRLRGLGNAVVPEVAELIGRYIIKAERNI